MGKTKLEIKTISDALYWTYANLAMAHYAVTNDLQKYNRTAYIIRARLFAGLKKGNMNISSLYFDEKERLKSDKICEYCNESSNLTLDHLIPKKLGGNDSADNLVYACRFCNSSKGGRDLLEWYQFRNEFPRLMLLRRYLKLCRDYIEQTGLSDIEYKSYEKIDIPFRIDLFPTVFPLPNILVL
ncbi:MAG: HNH endonuclease [Defluviitaleaceae bacterium]|nr:HNH endonuclease [Defluviitaleaceae bacterium]